MLITICHLTLHDYLFYASREVGRLYETEKYLHNYGLTYALGLVKSPFSNLAQVPHYQEDLAVMNEQGIYVTPAHPLHCTFAFHTFKMANVAYYSRTEQISSNQIVFGRAKELVPESTFQFFVLSKQAIRLPSWIRLGKWMAKGHVQVQASVQAAQVKEGPFQVKGALNPLDVDLIPENCNIIAMAPASLLTNAHYNGPHYQIGTDSKNPIFLPAGMRYQVRR
jgi:CRISPR-associated protein Csc1